MPAKPSLEPRKSTIRQTQKNGDIYVLERVIQYDPEKKYNRVLSTTLQTVNCFDSLQVAILGKPPERKKSPIQESKIGDSSEGSYPQRL